MIGKKLTLFALSILLTATAQAPSWAGEILDKIKQTGTITAGVRKDAIPFGYINAQGQWVGYSKDILELIRQEVEQQVGRSVKLQFVEVTPQNRFDKIKTKAIDIECASTTFTWERDKNVDFTMSYFASGTQLLVKNGSGITSLDTLIGKRIGVIPNTTNEKIIREQQPAAQLVMVKDRNEGLALLEKGEIDGFASDGIVLEGLKREASNPVMFSVVPEFPYQYEAYACMVPQDESEWLNVVNYGLVKYMQGVVTDEPKAVAVYEKWFGEDGVTPYPRETMNDYYQGILNGVEWIPLLGY
ncbi:MAG: amino acid ABC transporter substrate-binding protein [Microcystaceae cyanobacterium]